VGNKPAPSALAAGEKGSYPSVEAAAIAGLRSIPKGGSNEVGGGVLLNQQNGQYAFTQPVGQSNGYHFGAAVQVPQGWQLQGIYHTHPSGPSSTHFSSDDVNMANQLKVPSYILPADDDTIRRLDPGKQPDHSAFNPSQSYSYGATVKEPQSSPALTSASASPTTSAAPAPPPPTVVPISGSSPDANDSDSWVPPEVSDSSWAPPEVSAPTWADRIKNVGGLAEAGLHAASTIPASLGGGLTYAGTLAATGDPSAAAAVQESTQNALTYQPRSQAGQNITSSVGASVAPVANAAGELAEKVGQGTAEETGSPLLGAAEKAGLYAIPMLIGGGGARGLKSELPATEATPGVEPTAPKGPGGFTREEFAPKPAAVAPEAVQEPPAAATPPQPSAPRTPVAGKPHIRPKAQPAAEPTPEAAPAQPAPPAAPSAAPDATGAPPPDVHDPNFFPAPDNQDLKSAPASPEEQTARQAAVERGAPTLPQVRDSAVTNDYQAQGRDWTGKQAGDPTATAQIAAEGQALHSEANRVSSETGGQMGVGESADTARGKAYQDWHDTTVDALNKHINAAYAAEDAQARGIATPGSNLKGVLTDDSLIDSANAGSARSSTVALGQKMGVDLTNPHAPMNAWQVEQLRKHANTIYPNAPRFAQAIKNAADADLPAGAYQNARALRTLKGQMFDNRDGINQLGASKDIDPATGKPRPENRPVKAPDVMKTIERMDPDQVRHIVGTMKDSSTILDRLGDHQAARAVTDKAYNAAQQLQSHFTERWTDEASKGGGWNTRRAHQYLRNNQETLSAVMSPDQMHQIRNVSNAANVLDLDKRYKGAFAQFTTGSHWLRQRLGRTAEGVLTDLIPMGNTIGEMTGLSEKARQVLGGPASGKPPKDFTRPLGQRIPKQGGYIGNPEKLPPVTHEIDDDGAHVVRSANGETRAFDKGDDIQIAGTKTNAGATGGGEGVARLQKLAQLAHDRGGRLLSDDAVSKPALGTYAVLKHLGYDVQEHPYQTTGSGGRVAWQGAGSKEPVFSVGPRALRAASGKNAVRPAAGMTMEDHFNANGTPAAMGPGGKPAKVPLGLRIGGGRQAGAVGDLGAARRAARIKPEHS
jgi:hypothetical protein